MVQFSLFLARRNAGNIVISTFFHGILSAFPIFQLLPTVEVALVKSRQLTMLQSYIYIPVYLYCIRKHLLYKLFT